ncbi:hypothetical protein BaRGS_00008452, partial [Batillaria attramentaria]
MNLLCLPVFGVVALCMQAAQGGGKRVIFWPLPFVSHARYHSNMGRALTKRGHEVWLALPDYLQGRQQIDTSDLLILTYRTHFVMEDETKDCMRNTYFTGTRPDWLRYFSLYRKYCDHVLTDPELFSKLKDELRPDLFVLDTVALTHMLTVLPYRLGVPFALAGTYYDPLAMRVPFSPASTPMQIMKASDHMDFRQRLTQLVLHLAFSLIWDPINYHDAVARYAPEMPYLPLDRLVAGAEVWLVEIDHVMDYPRPSLPNVKLIGATAGKPAGPLPLDLQEFMDDSGELGVVVASFGYSLTEIPEEISRKMLAALLALKPMRAVFKSNLTSPDPDYIKTMTWIPQNNLLGHKNTKVFVTHCGKNGQYEALHHAVPMVGVPIFGDQHYNAERMRVKGFGEVLDIKTVSEQELTSVIKNVAKDARYLERIQKASHIHGMLFGLPMEQAAWWLDHVLQYGGDYMRSSSQEMALYQFLMLDCFAFLLLCLLSCIVSSCLL